MKKFLTVAAVASAAFGLPLLTAASALADDNGGGDDSLITVGEGSCVAPWYWEGPVTFLNGPEQYKACDGTQAPHTKPGDLAGVLDDSCIAPWHWEGPGTAGDGVLGTLTGTPDQPTTYDACNAEPMMPMPPMAPPAP
jgi:hypothetical protein